MKVDMGEGMFLDKHQMVHMCADKRNTFRTKRYAMRILNMMNRHREERGEPKLNIYKCRLCGNYHFTKTSKQSARDGKRNRLRKHG